MPIMAEKQAKGRQAAQALQLQQAAAGISPQQITPTAAGRLGAASAQTAGEGQVKAAQTAAGQQDQLGQLGLQERGQAARSAQFDREAQLRQDRIQAEARLSNLSQDAKRKILDSRLQFNQDQAGQKYLNERQLADWMITKAKSKEEFNNMAQQAQQAHQKKLQIMDTAQKKLTQVLEQGYIKKKGDLDQETRKTLIKARIDMQERIAKEQADAANKNSMWSTGGTIIGTAAGAYFGGPAGAAAGGAAGGAVGSMIGSEVDEDK